jgi:NhaP-type Na+/H+ or K+/H+ antiporter
MTIKNVLIRFSLTCAPLLIASAILVSYFNSSSILLISAFALWTCAKGWCTRFIEKNSRDFTKDEKITVFWGIFLIALAVDFGFLAIIFCNFIPISKMSSLGISGIFLLSIMLILARAIPAYIAVGVHKKTRLPNQLQKDS